MLRPDPIIARQKVRVGGLVEGGVAWWLLRFQPASYRWVVFTDTDTDAANLSDNLKALAQLFQGQKISCSSLDKIAYYPEEDDAARSSVLAGWREGDVNILVCSSSAARLPVVFPSEFGKSILKLNAGLQINRDLIIKHLNNSGYVRMDIVESVGEVAVRGEVMDVWSPGFEAPLRIVCPYDTVESIRQIDLFAQRSTKFLEMVKILPAKPGEGTTLSSYFSQKDILFLAGADFPRRNDSSFGTDMDPINGKVKRMPRPNGTVRDFQRDSVPGGCEGRRCVVRTDVGQVDIEMDFRSSPAISGNINLLRPFLKQWEKDKWRIVIFCNNTGECERFQELLTEGVFPSKSPRLEMLIGPLSRGFISPTEKLAVLSNAELFGRYRRRLRLPKFSGGRMLATIGDLSAGDYVVHERYGIGRYKGLERISAGGVTADYLHLEYRNRDRLYVPLFEFRQVQKFIGAEGKRPRLSSLDTVVWERVKSRVRSAVADLARGLLSRAAKRKVLSGCAFSADPHMEGALAESFIYELTPDQQKAIEDVKHDMSLPRPMDRLVCGDVGYGKTEVAMRAAFRSVLGSKQVAVLVPTTILAEQHAKTFRERFADYPVSITVLSRFARPTQQKRVLVDLRRGVIDIIIGTHRLLSGDIVFKDLGLVIIDEEHRFGVRHKEKLLAFRDVMDVLALSATPIPRTLASALGGLKALSAIETPPEGRLPIATYVGPFGDGLALDAIKSELSRGGQVFYVYNRVATIDARRRWLEHSLPHGVRVGLAHGQMNASALEKTMWDFMHRKYDVLLATSIIESGLDIPTVNSLIVEEAENFGLAQLYQLRGRVGRERQKAYCYLFFSRGRGLTEEASKRLTALKEFSALGSGFRLAIRDLEIRGAGNLLGPEQHGFVNAVGVDLYGQLLMEEIKRQRGESPGEVEKETVLELLVSAYLPEEYLPSEAERVALYKRLLAASEQELPELKEELKDRCGSLPSSVGNLFEIASLRLLAKKTGVSKVTQTSRFLEILFWPEATISQEVLAHLAGEFSDTLLFIPGPPFGMRISPVPQQEIVLWLKNFLSKLG